MPIHAPRPCPTALRNTTPFRNATTQRHATACGWQGCMSGIKRRQAKEPAEPAYQLALPLPSGRCKIAFTVRGHGLCRVASASRHRGTTAAGKETGFCQLESRAFRHHEAQLQLAESARWHRETTAVPVPASKITANRWKMLPMTPSTHEKTGPRIYYLPDTAWPAPDRRWRHGALKDTGG